MTGVDQKRADDPGGIELVCCTAFRAEGRQAHRRAIPEEVPVALAYNGATHAVMMATPADLNDFAVGFSVSERIVASADEIASIEILHHAEGIELQIWLRAGRAEELTVRRRRLAGPTGCGLCGVESLGEVVPPLPFIGRQLQIGAADVNAALGALSRMQELHLTTGAVHAAGFYVPGEGLLALREDVGRHNALDKLIGGLARDGIAGARGIAVLTSRVSVEMVQKAATYGMSAIIAISVPTAFAVRLARQVGLTLIAVARHDGFEVFTYPEAVV